MSSLAFDNVSFSYHKRQTLFERMSFSFSAKNPGAGYIVALMGMSGSGKSTLVKLLNGSLRPQSGEIRLEPSQPVISYLPQESVLFSHLTPYANAAYFKDISAYRGKFDQQLFDQLAGVLNISDVLHNSRSIDELSGGQRQRLALLRALSIRPDILFLDEPLAGLDGIVKINLMNQIRELVLQQGILAVYVSHNKSECDVLADEIAYLYYNPEVKNNVLYCGELRAFNNAPPVLEAFRSFSYPRLSVLSCRIAADELLLCTADEPGAFFAAVRPEQLTFGGDTGYDYSVLSANGLLALLELGRGQQLTADPKFCAQGQTNKLQLNGSLLKYSASQEFIGNLEVKDNKLI